MKIRSSLKNVRLRDPNCKIVRRGKRVYIINKVKPKFKVKQ